jgi:hypothetical protein
MRTLFLAVVCCFLAGAMEAKAPAKHHAVVKVARAVTKTVTMTPRVTAIALKDTLGAILFTTESGVDVIHAATSALSKASGAELKHNPFEYVDATVAKVDSGLEKAYLYFFNATI